MNRRFILYFIGLLFSSVCLAKPIKVGSPEWPTYTNADGTGVYNELLKEVYGDTNVQFHIDSYQRTLHSFDADKLDIVVGVYREDVPNGHFPKWHLDREAPVVAFYDKRKHQLSAVTDFKNLVLSWVRGYQFQRFIETEHHVYQVNSVEEGLHLLANGRIDGFVDFPYNILESEESWLGKLEILPSRPVYLAFHDSERGKELAALFDKRMLELRDSGRLAEIFGEYYAASELATFDPAQPYFVIKTTDFNLLKGKETAPHTTLEGTVLSNVMSQLSGIDIHYGKLDTTDEWLSKHAEQDNVCLSNMIKTDERAQQFLFSEPFALYAGVKVFAMTPLHVPTDKPINLLDLMAKNPHYTIGFAPGQAYAGDVNRQVELIATRQKRLESLDTLQGLIGLRDGLYTLKLEYPNALARHWPKVSSKPVYGYAVEGAPSHTLGHLACYRSAAAEQFLKQFNQALRQFQQTQAFYSAHLNQVLKADREALIAILEAQFRAK